MAYNSVVENAFISLVKLVEFMVLSLHFNLYGFTVQGRPDA